MGISVEARQDLLDSPHYLGYLKEVAVATNFGQRYDGLVGLLDEGSATMEVVVDDVGVLRHELLDVGEPVPDRIDAELLGELLQPHVGLRRGVPRGYEVPGPESNIAPALIGRESPQRALHL